MSANTKIEWCDHTFNPWIGCTKVSPACDNCYAEVSTPSRTLGVTWGAGQQRRRTTAANWSLPLRWDAQAIAFHAQHGRRQRVFCASLADVFDNEVPDEWRTDLFRLIEATPNLDWLLLTKRIGNAKDMFRVALWDIAHKANAKHDTPLIMPPNIWLGATICNQEEADRDIPKLLRTPAVKRFLSIEPLLGPVDLAHLNKDRETNEFSALKAWNWEEEVEAWRDTDPDWIEQFEDFYGHLPGARTGPAHQVVDWVIVGGESGLRARPMHPDWARALRDQCAAAGVPFLFKQHGEWMPTELEGANVILRFPVGAPHGPDQPQFHDWPDGAGSARVGKKAAGRLLDGIQHDGYPT